MFADYPILCLVTSGELSARSRTEDAGALLLRIAAAAQAGVTLVQIREPGMDARALHELVTAAVRVVDGTPARVIVNDRVDVAIASGAHGVHLKDESMPLERVRAVVPRPLIVGRSIHRVRDVAREGADYVIFGTVFETASKAGRTPAGVEALRAVVAGAGVPVLAIGGVSERNLHAVRASGAAGFAAIGFFDVDPAAVGGRCAAARRAFDTPPPVP